MGLGEFPSRGELVARNPQACSERGQKIEGSLRVYLEPTSTELKSPLKIVLKRLLLCWCRLSPNVLSGQASGNGGSSSMRACDTEDTDPRSSNATAMLTERHWPLYGMKRWMIPPTKDPELVAGVVLYLILCQNLAEFLQEANLKLTSWRISKNVCCSKVSCHESRGYSPL